MLKGESPKLHIKISRSDDDIEIMNKSNISGVDVLLPTETYENFTIFTQQLEGNWTSPEPATLYPENIRQK